MTPVAPLHHSLWSSTALGAHCLASLSIQLSPGTPSGITGGLPYPAGIYMGVRGLNFGPQACVASTTHSAIYLSTPQLIFNDLS